MIIIQQFFRLITLILYFQNAFLSGESFIAEFKILSLFQFLYFTILFIATAQIQFHKQVDDSRFAIMWTLGSIFLPLCFDLGDSSIVSQKLGIFIFLLGSIISGISVLELWSSFDFLPSYRKIKISGPYQYVRHPIYLGYIIGLIGHCLFSFSISNLGVSFCIFYCLYQRAKKEEQYLLQNSPQYKDYFSKVNSMLLPGIL